jgi:glycolate oxidase iron-sulfur subunit
MNLGLDDDELNMCVQCGLCLPHCPTFRVTGDESQSPRGRIALMRAVHNDGAPVTGDVLRAWDSCVQCRGCETACPSGVPYGHLMEATRESLADAHLVTPRWQRWAYRALEHPRLLRMGTSVMALAQRAHLVPRRLGLARLPVRSHPMVESGHDVWLFTGCVMDAWQRDVHVDGQRVLEAAGFGVRPTGALAPCCGALQVHAGLTDMTRALAGKMIEALRGDQPVIVDSAGCGAAMKDYGHLLGTPEARAFSARVFDISEFLAQHLDKLPAASPLDVRVAVQDPCHLRHVQRVHEATRKVLRPFVRELVELDDEGLCCGAGGAYSALHPDLAAQIRSRKAAAIGRAAPDVVASANPGCAMHLGTVTTTAHPMTLVRRALDGRK